MTQSEPPSKQENRPARVILEFDAQISDEAVAETVRQFDDGAMAVESVRLPLGAGFTAQDIETFLGIVVYGAEAVKLIFGAAKAAWRRFGKVDVRVEFDAGGATSYRLPGQAELVERALRAIPSDADAEVQVRFTTKRWNSDGSRWEETQKTSFRWPTGKK